MPPRKKRKATEESEEAPDNSKSSKKSKKEILAEARARAKQWAEVETAKKKAMTPQHAKSKATPGSPTVQKPSSSPAPKITITAPVPDVHSTNKGGPSLEEKITQARARAKAWAAAEQLDKIIAASAESAPTSQHKNVQSQSNQTPICQDSYNTEDEAQEEPPTETSFAPSQPSSSLYPSFTMSESTAPVSSAKVVKVVELLPPTTSSPAKYSMPHKVKSEVASCRGDSVEKCQSELELIQELVMANAVAYQSKTKLMDPVLSCDQSDLKPRHPLLIRSSVLVFLAVAAIASIQIFVRVIPMITWLNQTSASSLELPPCFSSHGISTDDELPNDTPAYRCDMTLPKVQCPESGRCRDGQLYFCKGRYLQVASDGSKCVLDQEANNTIAKVEAILTNWTVQHFCNFNGVPFAHASKSKAGCLFPLTKLSDEVSVDQLLLWRAQKFEIVKVDQDFFVGFSDDYVESNFSLPTTCWVGLVAVDTFTALASSSFYALLYMISAICSVSFAYPLASIISLVVLLVIRWTRGVHMARKQLIADVATVRAMAYERMISDPHEHVVLHLRDGIAMDQHPTSKRERSYIILQVWPKVVADVRLDNRVLKTTRMVGGKPRDVWQWIANPSSHTKKKFS